jgi:putative endonuclease
MEVMARKARKKRPPHLRVGRQGERIAEEYLRGQGYQIRDRNVRIGEKDEIDLLVYDPVDDVLVFVEVKTRKKHQDDFPAEINAGWKKRFTLRRAMRRWVGDRDFDGGYRMDLICVEGGAVREHFMEIGTR